MTTRTREIDPRFEDLIAGFDDLDYYPSVVLGLWPNLSLAYLNIAWYKFGSANGAENEFFGKWRVGSSLVDALPDVVRAYYLDFYASCLSTGRAHRHVYECSSPAIFRCFQLTVFPLGHGQGILAVNTLLKEELYRTPEPSEVSEPLDVDAPDSRALSHCIHCRRFRRNEPASEWQWVPRWVSNLPSGVKHQLCDRCLRHYYQN